MISLNEYAQPDWMQSVKGMKFDRKTLARFKRAYKKAVIQQLHPDGRKTFEFDGRIVLIDFAKFLIEFLEDQFRIMNKNK